MSLHLNLVEGDSLGAHRPPWSEGQPYEHAQIPNTLNANKSAFLKESFSGLFLQLSFRPPQSGAPGKLAVSFSFCSVFFLSVHKPISVCVCMYVCTYVCVCVCMCMYLYKYVLYVCM